MSQFCLPCSPYNKVAVNITGALNLGPATALSAIGSAIGSSLASSIQPRCYKFEPDLCDQSDISETSSIVNLKLLDEQNPPPAYEKLPPLLPCIDVSVSPDLPAYVENEEKTNTAANVQSDDKDSKGIHIELAEVFDDELHQNGNRESSPKQGFIQGLVNIATSALQQLAEVLPDLRSESISNMISSIQSSIESKLPRLFASEASDTQPDMRSEKPEPSVAQDVSETAFTPMSNFIKTPLTTQECVQLLDRKNRDSDAIFAYPELTIHPDSNISNQAKNIFINTFKYANREAGFNDSEASRSFVDSQLLKHPEYFTQSAPEVRQAALKRLASILETRSVTNSNSSKRRLPIAAMMRSHMIDHPDMDVRKLVYKRLENMLNNRAESGDLRDVILNNNFLQSKNPTTRKFARRAMGLA